MFNFGNCVERRVHVPTKVSLHLLGLILVNYLAHDSLFNLLMKLFTDMEQSEERKDFLQEIQLMKSVGFHSNIVNMLGCCTIKHPMCLVVEYVPYGDLLHYLRKRRGDVSYFSRYVALFFCATASTGCRKQFMTLFAVKCSNFIALLALLLIMLSYYSYGATNSEFFA